MTNATEPTVTVTAKWFTPRKGNVITLLSTEPCMACGAVAGRGNMRALWSESGERGERPAYHDVVCLACLTTNRPPHVWAATR